MTLRQSVAAALLLSCCLAYAASNGGEGSSESRSRRAEPARDSSPLVQVQDDAADSDGAGVVDPRDEAAEKAWKNYQGSVFDSLSHSVDPRDWALATLVHVSGTNPAELHQDDELIARSAAQSPSDALAQWIAVQTGRKSAPTTRANALRALHRLEPDNAAVWNEDLIRAAEGRDPDAMDAALARMAAATRFDIHWTDAIKALIGVYDRLPPPADYVRLMSNSDPEFSEKDFAGIIAAATTAAMAIPALQHVINACRAGSSPAHDARADDCGAVGRLMVSRGDTLIINRIGYAVMRASRTFTEEDVLLARPDDWVYGQFTAILHASGPLARERDISYQHDWLETGSEMEAMRRVVAGAGIALTPPNDWVDDRSPFSEERLNADVKYQSEHAEKR